MRSKTGNKGRVWLAALAGMCVAMQAGAVEFFGPVPYLSAADTPVGFADGPTVIEDFEDGLADPNLSFPLGGQILGPTGITDSVDADDGVIDGSGTGGHSLFWSPPLEVAFAQPFPTSAGLVWTDGGTPTGGVVFEAFGPEGESLGSIGPFTLGDASNIGGTAEDRFFGVRDEAGIARIRITHDRGGLEIDHIHFNVDTIFSDSFED